MNFLFVVCGEGLGHASRCLHLGQYFKQQGQTVHFAAYGKSFDFISQHGCSNVYRTSREVCLEGVNGFFFPERDTMVLQMDCIQYGAIGTACLAVDP